MTPERFDRMLSGETRTARPIWTLQAIANRMGCSIDFVRDTVARLPGTPVRKMGARWYAFEDEIDRFMRGGSPTHE